jgi:hypothetical protein
MYTAAECFLDFGVGGAEADQRLDVEADASIAVSGHAEREGDELFGLGVEHARRHGRACERAEAVGDLRNVRTQLHERSRNGPGDLLVAFLAHGVALPDGGGCRCVLW